MTDKIVKSTCKECPTRCGSIIYMRDEKVVRIAGNPEQPSSRGAFCVKGMNAPQAARDHPDRPLHPLKRVGQRGAGQWERVTWDQALDEIADRWTEVKKRHGAPSIAGACTNHANSRGVAVTLLLRGVGSPNYMINQDLCSGNRYTASTFMGVPPEGPGNEIPHSKCVLVVGRSPSDSHVVTWMNIKLAKRQGAKLIVIDPRKTQLAAMADIWLQLIPGTDAALALGMINVMFAENLIDKDFVETWCVGVEALRQRCTEYPLARTAEITGVPGNLIVEAARTFGTQKPGMMLLGHGIDAQANGVMTHVAFFALLALSGNIDVKGGNRVSARPEGFNDYYTVMNLEKRFRLPHEVEAKVIGNDQFPLWSGLNAWSRSSHNPSLIKAILTGKPYPVRALYVTGANIICTYPNTDETIAAFAALDCLVVATDHINPTAEYADFILPKTTLLEEEDVHYDPAGPCLIPNQAVLGRRGDVRTDLEIAIALTEKLRKRGAVEYDMLPWKTHREFIEYQMEGLGVTFDEICARGFHEFPLEYRVHEKEGFRTPSGKVELSFSKLAEFGQDPLPQYVAPNYAQKNLDYDLILLTGIRSMPYVSSLFRNHAWARKLEGSPELMIHPSVAERHGIAAKEWVWIEVPGGKRRVFHKAVITDGLASNVVSTGSGWWYPEFGGADRGALQFNLESSISYGPPFDPISGSPEARNVLCRIGRADQAEVEAIFKARRVAPALP